MPWMIICLLFTLLWFCWLEVKSCPFLWYSLMITKNMTIMDKKTYIFTCVQRKIVKTFKWGRSKAVEALELLSRKVDHRLWDRCQDSVFKSGSLIFHPTVLRPMEQLQKFPILKHFNMVCVMFNNVLLCL